MAAPLGRSAPVAQAIALVERYAKLPDPVVFVGPTGVGKGLLAQYLHELSGRSGAFEVVTGGQLVESLFHSQLFGHVRGAFTGADRTTEGAFERARDGTLFLDELAHWSRNAQSAVLRAVDERRVLPLGAGREIPVTCRFLFASCRPLDELMAEDRLIPDLRYRIGEFVIEIPPLLKRRVDIAVLAHHFLDLRQAGPASRGPIAFTPAALARLLAFNWPGNVRQLRAVVDRAVVHADGADFIDIMDLPPSVRSEPPTAPTLTPEDRGELAAWALKRAGSRRAAATLLGIHPNTLDYRRNRIAGSDAALHR